MWYKQDHRNHRPVTLPCSIIQVIKQYFYFTKPFPFWVCGQYISIVCLYTVQYLLHHRRLSPVWPVLTVQVQNKFLVTDIPLTGRQDIRDEYLSTSLRFFSLPLLISAPNTSSDFNWSSGPLWFCLYLGSIPCPLCSWVCLLPTGHSGSFPSLRDYWIYNGYENASKDIVLACIIFHLGMVSSIHATCIILMDCSQDIKTRV